MCPPHAGLAGWGAALAACAGWAPLGARRSPWAWRAPYCVGGRCLDSSTHTLRCPATPTRCTCQRRGRTAPAAAERNRPADPSKRPIAPRRRATSCWWRAATTPNRRSTATPPRRPLRLHVIFKPAPGAAVNVTGPIYIYASHLTLEDMRVGEMTIGNYDQTPGRPNATGVTLRDVVGPRLRDRLRHRRADHRRRLGPRQRLRRTVRRGQQQHPRRHRRGAKPHPDRRREHSRRAVVQPRAVPHRGAGDLRRAARHREPFAASTATRCTTCSCRPTADRSPTSRSGATGWRCRSASTGSRTAP